MAEAVTKRTGLNANWLEYVSRARILLLIGGILNITVISFGVRDVFSQPMGVAVVLAVILVGVQYLLGSGMAGSGILALIRGPAYIFMIVINLVLAVSGIVAVSSPDSLGRRSFESVVAAPKAQIEAVAASFDGTDRTLQALSAYSNRRAAEEENPGGTCGPTTDGRGPVYRIRQQDKTDFGSLATQFGDRARTMTGIKTQLDAAIGSYSVARHAQTASQINALVERARGVAADPTTAAMRDRLAARLNSARTMTRDPGRGVLVRCPDAELESALSAVLAVAPPQVRGLESVPAEPSHRSAALAYVAAVWAMLNGKPFDAELWGFPTALALFPDVLFLLGIWEDHRDRRRRRRLVGELAEALIPGQADDWHTLAQAAERAASSEQVEQLVAYHSSKATRLGRTEFLLVPDGAEHRGIYLICLGLTALGKMKYAGLGPAGLLHRAAVPRPADPTAPTHFFVLKSRVWQRLLLESLRELSRAQSYPGDGGEEVWREAAE